METARLEQLKNEVHNETPFEALSRSFIIAQEAIEEAFDNSKIGSLEEKVEKEIEEEKIKEANEDKKDNEAKEDLEEKYF